MYYQGHSMFEKLKNWWNKDKIRQQQVNNMFAELTQKFAEQTKQFKEHEIELEETKKELEVYRLKEKENEERYDSTEPWIEVKSAKHDDVKGIQIELDWNNAFIQYLKENGITGKDEEIAVQKYLGLLYEDLIQRFEQRAIDNSDKPRINDFE